MVFIFDHFWHQEGAIVRVTRQKNPPTSTVRPVRVLFVFSYPYTSYPCFFSYARTLYLVSRIPTPRISYTYTLFPIPLSY